MKTPLNAKKILEKLWNDYNIPKTIKIIKLPLKLKKKKKKKQ